MSCNNCTCAPPVDVDLTADKLVELEKALKRVIGLIESVNNSVLDVNEFLRSKYPEDLGDEDHNPITASHWVQRKLEREKEERKVQNMIWELKNRGYTVETPVVPEHTIENAIREVVRANTITK
jgi:hypothetical protein